MNSIPDSNNFFEDKYLREDKVQKWSAMIDGFRFRSVNKVDKYCQRYHR